MKIIKEVLDSGFRNLSAFGALPFYLFICLFMLITQDLKIFYWLMIGLVSAYFFAMIFRLMFFRERPKKKKYKNIFEKIDASSFPSLHSWRIAMITYFLGFYYNSIALIILFSIITLAVMFSRVYLRRHYISDVFFGALFGIISSVLIIIKF